MFRHQGRVGEAEHGGGVVENKVEVTAAGQPINELLHAGRAQQPGGIWWPPAGGDHAPAGIVGHRLHGLAPMQVVVGEQVAESGEVVDAEAMVDLGFAQVGIDQQHPLPHFRDGFGQ